MNKIGILTFQFAHNYGALLQAYALKEYLDKYYTVEVLNYIPKKVKYEYSINPFFSNSFKVFLGKIKKIPKRMKQYSKFESFKKEFLHLDKKIYKEEDFERKVSQLDYVVVGSDQVWNTSLTGNIETYFSVPGAKNKISYAASFGSTDIDTFQKETIGKYLREYNAISVREKSAVDIIKNETNINVDLVCDPVFLLSKDKWNALISKISRKEIKDKYILFYSLKNDLELRKIAKKISNDTNLPIFCIHPTMSKFFDGEKLLNDVGPIEFVWLISNAHCVVSDSFHATAFSIIFRKKMYYYDASNHNTRVKSIIDILNIDAKENKYDFSSIDVNRLNNIVKTSQHFLNCVLMRQNND